MRRKQRRDICHQALGAFCMIIKFIEGRYHCIDEFRSILLLQLMIKKWNLARSMSDARGPWANRDVSNIIFRILPLIILSTYLSWRGVSASFPVVLVDTTEACEVALISFAGVCVIVLVFLASCVEMVLAG